MFNIIACTGKFTNLESWRLCRVRTGAICQPPGMPGHKYLLIVTVFQKTDHLSTRTEIHLLPVHDRPLMHYPETSSTRQQIARSAFTDGIYQCCQTTRVHLIVLGGINRAAWGTKLLLTAALASLMNCISLCHILKAYHCSLSLCGCVHPPATLPDPTSQPTPSYPSTLYRFNL